jgi:pectin methylesterase-like acyl-CoA thioesterase
MRRPPPRLWWPSPGTQVLHVPRDYSTIQAAVDAAGAGDTVQVKAGVYNENVVVSTSSVRLHATSGVVLDGTGLTGIGILVRGTLGGFTGQRR